MLLEDAAKGSDAAVAGLLRDPARVREGRRVIHVVHLGADEAHKALHCCLEGGRGRDLNHVVNRAALDGDLGDSVVGGASSRSPCCDRSCSGRHRRGRSSSWLCSRLMVRDFGRRIRL